MSEHEIDAHRVTAPDGRRFISLDGAAAYEGLEGYEIEAVRGYDHPSGYGFKVTGTR